MIRDAYGASPNDYPSDEELGIEVESLTHAEVAEWVDSWILQLYGPEYAAIRQEMRAVRDALALNQ